MKIIIDAYQYSPAITGTDRMAYNFLVELQKLDTENNYIILCSREKYTRSSITNKNFTKYVPPLICSLPVIGRYASFLWRKLIKHIVIRLKADVYFSFHNMALPDQRVAPKMIASNLDLIPIVLDEYKGLGRLSFDQQLKEYKRVAKLADKFMSISEYSKNELSSLLGVADANIKVIYLAADPDFKVGSEARKSIEGEYIFSLGGSEPRKNVQVIIKAYQQLPDRIKNKYKLVIAGGSWHGRTLTYPKDKQIVELGYVPDSSLPDLYANAAVFVFASVYEGFGFTVLEAMAAGTAVINARGSSLDEVAGDASLSFDPKDPNELSEQITKVVEDEALRQELIQKGYLQNHKFSWEESAQQLLRLFVEN